MPPASNARSKESTVERNYGLPGLLLPSLPITYWYGINSTEGRGGKVSYPS